MVVWLKPPLPEIAFDHGLIRREQWQAVQACDDALRMLEMQREAILRQAEAEALSHVEHAKEQAELIRGDAFAQADYIRDLAGQLGLAEGLQQWQARWLAGCESQHAQVLARRERLARLVLGAVERVIGSRDRRALFELAMNELSKAAENLQYATLRVAPCDEEAARGVWRQACEHSRAVRLLEIVASDDLAPGSCELSTDEAFVDMSLGVQMQALRQMIDQALAPAADASPDTDRMREASE